MFLYYGMWSLSKNLNSDKNSSFSRKRESSIFKRFCPESVRDRSSRRMTNPEFLDRLCVPVYFLFVPIYLIKEFLEAQLRGYCSPYSVIPACRESFRSIRYTQQYSKAKKDSGQAGMTSLIPRPESLRDCWVVHL